MNKPLQQIAQEALQLPLEDREALMEMLLASLPPEPGYDQAWAEELDRRIAAVESGATEVIPGDVVFARLKSSLK